MSSGQPVEKRGNIVSRLERLPVIHNIAVSYLHFLNALKAGKDFNKLHTLNGITKYEEALRHLHPSFYSFPQIIGVEVSNALEKRRIGETAKEIDERLHKNLGNGPVYQITERITHRVYPR
jgi:hypothetical protein